MRVTSAIAALVPKGSAIFEKADTGLRLLVVAALLFWNTFEGAVFESEYPAACVKLYPIPIWRLLLVVALIAAAQWCPSVALMFAFTLFFYTMDMEVTMDKWK
jgi:hypothetical protein